jgi:hypothetical protein
MSEELDPAAREHLGKVAAARYEATTFMSAHPEFFASPENSQTMLAYMEKHNLVLNAENYSYALEKLKAAGKIIPAKEALAKMSADEFKEFVDKNGFTAYDHAGREYKELPASYLQESTVNYNRKSGPVGTMRQARTAVARRESSDFARTHPWEQGRKITKAQYAMLDADHQSDLHDWLEENNVPLKEVVR